MSQENYEATLNDPVLTKEQWASLDALDPGRFAPEPEFLWKTRKPEPKRCTACGSTNLTTTTIGGKRAEYCEDCYIIQ